MSLKQKIANDLKSAMKEGNLIKRDTLRMLDSMIRNVEIEKKKREEGLNDQEILEVFSRAIKQRRDSFSQYESGGRMDLAEKEKKEMEILSAYLPKQLKEEEIKKEIRQIISNLDVATKTDMGNIMGMAMKKLKGLADGQLVRKLVEKELE
jgi:uncharacterized protein